MLKWVQPKNLWHPKNVILIGLSCLQQIFDSMSHMAVIKILFATVALENTVADHLGVGYRAILTIMALFQHFSNTFSSHQWFIPLRWGKLCFTVFSFFKKSKKNYVHYPKKRHFYSYRVFKCNCCEKNLNNSHIRHLIKVLLQTA